MHVAFPVCQWWLKGFRICVVTYDLVLPEFVLENLNASVHFLDIFWQYCSLYNPFFFLLNEENKVTTVISFLFPSKKQF